MKEHLKLEIWKEYENIAMHFNTLLIQLRIRALGGLGVIVALIGFASKSNESSQVQWPILGGSFLVLAIAWTAIYILDIHYYNKLLLGAISSTVKLESSKDENIGITFSTDVKNYIEDPQNKFLNLWPIKAFYIIVFILLLGSSLFAFWRSFCII